MEEKMEIKETWKKEDAQFFLDKAKREADELWYAAEKWTGGKVPDKVMAFEVCSRQEAILFWLSRLQVIINTYLMDGKPLPLTAREARLQAKEKRLAARESRLAARRLPAEG